MYAFIFALLAVIFECAGISDFGFICAVIATFLICKGIIENSETEDHKND